MSNIFEFPSAIIKLRNNFKYGLNKALQNVEPEHKKTLITEGMKTLKKYEDDFYASIDLETKLTENDVQKISDQIVKDFEIKFVMVLDIALLKINKILDDIDAQTT